MSDALITGLAALAGALIGGLTTVLATHLQNRSAAKVERERSKREAAYSQFQEMKLLLAEFLGEFMQVYALELKAERADAEQLKTLNILRARLLILAPEMRAPVDMMRGTLRDQAAFTYAESLRAYEAAAENLLDRINPDTPLKNIEKMSRPAWRR